MGAIQVRPGGTYRFSEFLPKPCSPLSRNFTSFLSFSSVSMLVLNAGYAVQLLKTSSPAAY